MPDAILLDWTMPVMSGIEFCASCGLSPAAISRPLCSAQRKTTSSAFRSAEGRRDEYMMKPFDGDIPTQVCRGGPRLMLNDAEFALIAREVKQRSGAVLTREMAMARSRSVCSRCRGARELRHRARADRGGRIRPDGALWNGITDALAQSETRFFRDRDQFAKLKDDILPFCAALPRPRERVRIWCAATSTGQEAYSVAMIVDDAQ